MLLSINIPIKIKTILLVSIVLLAIIFPFFVRRMQYIGGMVWKYFLEYIIYFYPALAIQLINSWLREIAHLDHPKQDKIDKLKKQLDALENDDTTNKD